VTVLLFALLRTILAGYEVAWTGFGDYSPSDHDYVRGKTLWDWMELFIIPVVLAGGAFWLQRSERTVERIAAEDRAKLEREIATDRQQEAALQAYLDRMEELLLSGKLREGNSEEAWNMMRVRTLTVLRGLNAARNAIVLRFLRDVELAGKQDSRLFVAANLEGADLKGVNLSNTNLEHARLDGANLEKAFFIGANLQDAIMPDTNLERAHLRHTDLKGAVLSNARLQSAALYKAILQNANLKDANLQGADLQNADLEGANLDGANLEDANLRGVNLQGASLRKTNLRGARVSAEQLATVKFLEGVTRHNGTNRQ
jgi:uncharacterized protein YjbI with pentapeptide repeats